MAGALVAAMTSAPGADGWEPAALVESAADGSFHLDVRDGSYGVTATAAGHTGAFAGNVKVAHGKADPIDLHLENGGVALHGVVADDRRRPAAGAVVAAARQSSDSGDVFFTRAGADGRYAVVVPTARYTLRASTTALVSDEATVAPPAAQEVGLDLDPKIDPPAPREVVDWLAQHAAPLVPPGPDDTLPNPEALRAIFGDAHIVGLGEAAHGSHEFAATKARLFRLLVERAGFSVLAVEASYPEALAVNDYVLRGVGDPALVLSRERFWITESKELLGLLRWMRAYNANRQHPTKVSFVGIDMQYPTNAVARVLSYLKKVDGAAVAELEPALLPVATEFGAENFQSLPADVRARTHDALVALDHRFDERKAAWSRHASAGDYQAARDLVTTLVESDALNQPPASERNRKRDRFLADNVLRIVHEAPGTRVAIWAANAHVAAEPYFGVTSMGGHLRAALGDDYLPVGFSFHRGSFNAMGIAPRRGLMQFTLAPTTSNTIDQAFARVGSAAFAVSLRPKPTSEPIARWLTARHRIRQIGSSYGEAMADAFLQPVRPTQSYGALVYVDEITPSQLLHERPLFDQPTLARPDNLDFEQGSAGGTPALWSIHPFAVLSGYRVELQSDHCKSGHGCAMVDHTAEVVVPNTAGLTQQIDAAPYRDNFVHVRAAVRVDRRNARTFSDGAILWVKALDNKGGTLTLGSSATELIVSNDWTVHEVSCRVPSRAVTLRYGVSVEGPVRAWFDDVAVTSGE